MLTNFCGTIDLKISNQKEKQFDFLIHKIKGVHTFLHIEIDELLVADYGVPLDISSFFCSSLDKSHERGNRQHIYRHFSSSHQHDFPCILSAGIVSHDLRIQTINSILYLRCLLFFLPSMIVYLLTFVHLLVTWGMLYVNLCFEGSLYS